MIAGLRFLALLACLVCAGCSTPDVNPSAPRAKKGYVDFYTDTNEDLSWDVKRANQQTGELHTAFWEFKTLPGNILRLAVPAGTNRFEVWFNNEFTTGPQNVLVPVAKAKVTPVHVTLAPAGTTAVQTQSFVYRSTAHATRRVTRIGSQQQQVFCIGLVASVPQDYQPKERMSYFAQPAK